jgi:DNA replication protein DnaC
MDRRPRQSGPGRPDRRRKKLVGVGPRPQGLPGNRSVLYQRVPRLFEELALARGDGRHPRILRSLGRADLLILDDWGLEPLDAAARHDLLEILEERYGRRSTVITSQLPVNRWHEVIGDPTYADAILDRLIHNAHRIELTGESLRRNRERKSGKA